jgi:hypothetical protein
MQDPPSPRKDAWRPDTELRMRLSVSRGLDTRGALADMYSKNDLNDNVEQCQTNTMIVANLQQPALAQVNANDSYCEPVAWHGIDAERTQRPCDPDEGETTSSRAACDLTTGHVRTPTDDASSAPTPTHATSQREWMIVRLRAERDELERQLEAHRRLHAEASLAEKRRYRDEFIRPLLRRMIDVCDAIAATSHSDRPA